MYNTPPPLLPVGKSLGIIDLSRRVQTNLLSTLVKKHSHWSRALNISLQDMP